MDETQPVESVAPHWLKRAIQISGLILMIVGLPAALSLLCILPVALMYETNSETLIYGVVSLTLTLLTFVAGGAAFLQADRSLRNKPSKPLGLPSPGVLLAVFLPLLGFGMIVMQVNFAAGLFLPFILIACALLPPLAAVSWMIPRASVPQVPAEEAPALEAVQPSQNLTWRRGLLAFAGGATVSVLIAILLEILLPVIVLSLVSDLAGAVSDSVRTVFRALSNADVAEALTDRGFIYVFVQIAIIAPLAEEFAKPLVTLPLLRRLSRQETFWIGALAGAGFAALENVVYAAAGLSVWAGILAVRALGGALHPLGSGLVAQGWWSVLHGEQDSGKNWLKRFGIAVAVHAAWNGGSLLVITLGGARLFGELPPEIDVLGLSAAGTMLAVLLILGLSALWIGRAYGHDQPILSVETTSETRFPSSDRALAIWALACLIAIVPAGIAGLKLWLR